MTDPVYVGKMFLVTMEEAKDHLLVDHDLSDGDINRKRLQASGIVIDYCKVDTQETAFDWVDENGEPDRVPPQVRAAVLLVLGSLFENRDGDAWRQSQPLSQAVMDLLHRTRKPAMA